MSKQFLQTFVGPRNDKCNLKINLNSPKIHEGLFKNLHVFKFQKSLSRDKAEPGERKLTSLWAIFSVFQDCLLLQR